MTRNVPRTAYAYRLGLLAPISFVSLSPPPSGLALHFFTGPRNRQGSFEPESTQMLTTGGDRATENGTPMRMKLALPNVRYWG